MTRAPVNLRNLERIHETSSSASPKLATFLLGASGIAAVIVSGWLLQDGNKGGQEQTADPLAALLSEANRDGGQAKRDDLSADELAFPDILSDEPRRTTALVAVRDPQGKLLPQEEPTGETGATAPPATDGLPTKTLAAGSLLNQTPVTTAPKDELTQLGHEASQVPADVQPAAPGTPGGFQVQ